MIYIKQNLYQKYYYRLYSVDLLQSMRKERREGGGQNLGVYIPSSDKRIHSDLGDEC